MKRAPQHQGSLVDQLVLLVDLANANGLYDAADYITRTVEYVRKAKLALGRSTRCTRCHRSDSRARGIPCAICNPVGPAAGSTSG